jgi:hypothetical protein
MSAPFAKAGGFGGLGFGLGFDAVESSFLHANAMSKKNIIFFIF